MDMSGTNRGASVNERSAARNTTDAALTASWWAAGTAVVVAPILASLFTVNRSPVFWPVLTILAVAGSAFGLRAHLRPSTRLADWLARLPTPMLVAIGYPISLGVGFGLENTGPGNSRQETIVLLAVTATPVAFGWLCRWGPLWPPPSGTRFASWVWIALSVLLFPLVGLGLLFIPLAVASHQAAKQLEHASADSCVTSMPNGP